MPSSHSGFSLVIQPVVFSLGATHTLPRPARPIAVLLLRVAAPIHAATASILNTPTIPPSRGHHKPTTAATAPTNNPHATPTRPAPATIAAFVGPFGGTQSLAVALAGYADTSAGSVSAPSARISKGADQTNWSGSVALPGVSDSSDALVRRRVIGWWGGVSR